jgi:hypothetical protein
MRRTGRALRMAVVLLAVGALPGGAATGLGPDDGRCTDGPATRASADRPHLVDPAGDGFGGSALPDRDLLAAWIGSTGHPDHVVTVNLQLAAGPGDHQVEYVVEYGDDRFVWARGSARGPFRFDYGWVERGPVVEGQELKTRFHDEGTTTGTVTSGGLVSVVLPAATLPAEDGAVLPFGVWTRTGISVVGWWGASVLVDDTGNAQRCTAVLDRPSG